MAEILNLFNSFDVPSHLLAFGVGAARIMIFISFVPFFGPQVTTAIVMPILLALYIPLHPIVYAQVQAVDLATIGGALHYIILILKESAIGFALAYAVGNIFYVALCAGIVIDNQRGASMAQGTEFLTGAESSPLGSVLFLASVTLFFSSGAFVNFLSLFYSTYVFWPVFDLLPALFSANFSIFMANELDWLMANALLTCAPFILVALLCDIALGLINRFAPQLNVFILSMPIKSGICALLIIFYFGPFLSHQEELFNHIREIIVGFETMFSLK